MSALDRSPTLAPLGEPFAKFQTWYREAVAAEPVDPNAMALATIGRDGQPSLRMVLLKSADERGFAFYTNYESRKGRQILENRRAALCLHWKSLARQVRIEGAVENVTDQEADRRLGIAAIAAPGRPFRSGKARCSVCRQIRNRQGAQAALLVGVPLRANHDRILGKSPVPTA